MSRSNATCGIERNKIEEYKVNQRAIRRHQFGCNTIHKCNDTQLDRDENEDTRESSRAAKRGKG